MLNHVAEFDPRGLLSSNEPLNSIEDKVNLVIALDKINKLDDNGKILVSLKEVFSLDQLKQIKTIVDDLQKNRDKIKSDEVTRAIVRLGKYMGSLKLE